MNRVLDKVVLFLEERGWKRSQPFEFTNGANKIVFDTSSYLEIFDIETGRRIAETHLESELTAKQFILDHTKSNI